jgi:ABC-type amino acid transport substrate-binding protein
VGVAATNKQLVKVVNKALAEVVADGRMDQFIEQFLVRRQLPFP